MKAPRWVDYVDRSTYLHRFGAFTYTDLFIIYEGTTPSTCGQLFRGGWTGPHSPPTKPVLNGHEDELGQTGPPEVPRDHPGGDLNRLRSGSPRLVLAGAR